MAVFKANGMAYHVADDCNFKKRISLLFLKTFCHLCPLECTSALSGRVNGVRNIYTLRFHKVAVGRINGVPALKPGILIRKCMGVSPRQN